MQSICLLQDYLLKTLSKGLFPERGEPFWLGGSRLKGLIPIKSIY
jgi:hypothetical protein